MNCGSKLELRSRGVDTVTRAIYNVLGIDREGHKELLGMYVSRNEGANFWLSVLTDLQNRGVEDILIACIDGLKGFPEAIQSVYPIQPYSFVLYIRFVIPSNM